MRNTIVILSIIILCGCNKQKTSKPTVQPLIVHSEDSLMVEQLIAQSKETYADKLNHSNPFDQYLKEAEDMAIKSQNSGQLFNIYTLVGQRYRNKSYYSDAMMMLQKALDIAESSDNIHFQTRAYNQIGVIYRRIDENPQALDMHMKALQLAEECNDSLSLSKAINGMGNVSIAMERHHSAIEYFRRGLIISRKMNNILGMAINTNNIGEAYFKLNQLDSAMHYYFRSLDYNTQINSRVGQSICYNSIGSAYIEKQQNRLALDYLMKALEINLELEDRMLTSVSYTQIGKTYLNDNLPEQAIYYLDKGLMMATDIGSKYTAEEAASLLSMAYEEKQFFRLSLEYFKKATSFKDSILNEKNIFHMASIEAKYNNTLQKLQIDELNKEALLQKTLLSKQRSLLAAVVTLVIVLVVIAVLIIFQGRLRSRYRNLRFQQRLLRSQMNPHFIFNALSAIQVFILENDMDKSSRFLAHFSKLMRHVLRSSNYEFIPIHEEIEMLQYYLKIQQLRFSPPFAFDIFISDEIKNNKVVIPPMLIQPFVENAIEHGLRPLGEGGKLIIRIVKDGKNMVLEVEDNGLGIDYSDQLSKIEKKHESMAIKITQERLNILSRDTRKKTHLEIFDKKRKDPFERGTIARIILPLTMQEATKLPSDE
ncbi:tetratricopeptide repeat-containing sensor histidine kinase [Carboxylicivirga marina]|uniref:Tetratricopeptide repeat protein n=1 Tax=Carboxylicivirga marina TaxID=2800988 RepID=A0ABS1HI67_9BACT|nr:tetratricopeptide repeat protein [Carboxylicivirga marina]MBK3517371.1 tetratricopeptide repeat protein [Carboxylicivirga marina]